MTISEFINENMYQPLPWSWLVFSSSNHFDLVVLDEGFADLALFVFAETDRKACSIWVLSFQNSIDNERTSVMSESFAGRLGDPIEKCAELSFNKISDILLMESDIVVNNLSKNHTKSTLVFKSSSQARS